MENTIVHNKQLLEMITFGNVPHAILLESEDLEKCFEISKYLVKKLLCENVFGDEEKKEIICSKIEKNIHPDVFILDCDGKSKTIGVNEVRDIRKTVYVKPNEALYKIYLFRDAATLTVQSQNALLKILEEPPYYVIFILICKSCNVLLDTIISRVQKFNIDSNNVNNNKIVVDSAEKIIESVLSKKEINIMKSTADFIKDKKFFKSTVLYIIDVLSKSILFKNCSDIPIECSSAEIIKKVSSDICEDKIFKFIDTFKYVCFLLDNNVNINLIVSYISFHLRELAIL